jgi:phosphoglycolate phosphatase
MPKNGQVSEKYALLLHITTQGDASCSHYEYCLGSGGGSMVSAILGSTKQEPTVVGKPSTFMMDYLAKK